jgi:hypothetical protein
MGGKSGYKHCQLKITPLTSLHSIEWRAFRTYRASTTVKHLLLAVRAAEKTMQEIDLVAAVPPHPLPPLKKVPLRPAIPAVP